MKTYYVLLNAADLATVQARLGGEIVYRLEPVPVTVKGTGRVIDSTPHRVVLKIETDLARDFVESIPGILRCRSTLKSREAYMRVEAEDRT